MDYAKELKTAKMLAVEAGEIILRYFRSTSANVRDKADKTLVTLADTEINSRVIEVIKATFPTHSVLGEEEEFHVENPKFTWVCDPVDGTMPFAKGIPISTFSLALVDGAGRSVVGVVYEPYQDRLYEAVVGKGAYKNGKRIHVSKKTDLELAYVDEELWVNEVEGVSFDDPKDRLNKSGAKVTTLCSAVMSGCLVASGEYDAMLFGQSKPVDVAALAVIVKEAGGRVTSLFGKDQRYDRPVLGAVVSNGLIHDQLVQITSSMNYKSTGIN